MHSTVRPSRLNYLWPLQPARGARQAVALVAGWGGATCRTCTLPGCVAQHTDTIGGTYRLSTTARRIASPLGVPTHSTTVIGSQQVVSCGSASRVQPMNRIGYMPMRLAVQRAEE